MVIGNKKYRYPLRPGNRFGLLIDGDCFFNAMLEAIGEANESIQLEQYLVHSGSMMDHFIKRFSEAALRGVSIQLLLDDYGSSELNHDDRERLQEVGVQLKFYNPVHFRHFHHSLFRTHRKMLIIDRKLAFIGGAGIADEFSKEYAGANYWHDVMLQIEGPVVTDWVNLFDQTWQQDSVFEAAKKSNAHATDSSVDTKAVDHALGRVLVNTPFHQQEINRSFIRQLRRVEKQAWITTPYFVASRKLRRALRRTARRGVDVRLLLPGPYSDHPWVSYAGRRHYMRLLRSGVRIFEFQPRFTHTKLLLCDNWVSTGSSNLDRWNQRWNLDANQAIYDADFAAEVRDLFMANFTHSQEISLYEWRQRPLMMRIREWFSGQLVDILERLGRHRKQGRKRN